MVEEQPQRVRKVHRQDDEIRQLREAGLSVVAVARQLELSRTYVERAVTRIRVGEEAELALRRAQQDAYRSRKRERDRREATRREADRARASAWAKAHPERHAQQTMAWADAHPDRRREIARASYERNKDKYVERMRRWEDDHHEERRERAKRDRERTRDHRAELQRIYRRDPEINARVLAANRERRQLIRRLERAGLPAKSLHPVTAAERRRNESEAAEFFRRARTAEERHRLREEYVPTPRELIVRWERRSARIRERQQELEAVKRYIALHGKQIREEITLDSRARIARGATPLDMDTETLRRAVQAIRRLNGHAESRQDASVTGPLATVRQPRGPGL
jgi:hypothetical protein